MQRNQKYSTKLGRYAQKTYFGQKQKFLITYFF